MRRALFVVCAAFVLASCSPMGPRRLKSVPGGWQVEEQKPVAELDDQFIEPARRSPEARSLGSSSWEHFKSFDVGIIEFQENGAVWSKAQREQVMKNVRALATTQGATIVVYVHGWHHSARWNDTNLVSFRKVLRALHRQQVGMGCGRPFPTRRSAVVGVYLGWRGESVPVPGANLFTIWSRKRVAQRIGGAATDWEQRHAKYASTDFADVLVQLDKIRDESNATAIANDRPFTSLAITGHSLGGAMILSAMQRIVFNATIDQAQVVSPARLNRLGDLVVLLNPAVEARRYKAFRAEAARAEFAPVQKPIMLTISSVGDWPNRVALRVARFFPSVVTPERWHEWRDSTTALGFSKPDVTHCIEAPDELLEAKIDDVTIDMWPFKNAAKELQLAGSRTIGKIVLTNEKKVNDAVPFFVASSNKALIPSHSDIFTPGVVSLVGPLVTASGQKNIDTYCSAPLMAQQGEK